MPKRKRNKSVVGSEVKTGLLTVRLGPLREKIEELVDRGYAPNMTALVEKAISHLVQGPISTETLARLDGLAKAAKMSLDELLQDMISHYIRPR
jgi:hypothetical protein